jgi:hypothetical protein
VAMATARAAWGGWARSLPSGVGVGYLLGGVLRFGVDGGGWVRLERGRGLAEREGVVLPRAPPSPRFQPHTTRGKGF